MSALAILALAVLQDTPPRGQDTPPREPGVSVRVYEIGLEMGQLAPLVPGQTPNASFVLPALDVEKGRVDLPSGVDESFVVLIEGWLEIPSAGRWGLRLTSDDGSALDLDGKPAIVHDGLHDLRTPRDVELDLGAGLHPFAIQWFQNYGGYGLALAWRKPGSEAFELVPASALSCRAGEVRVTSPGRKRLIGSGKADHPGDGLPLEAVHPCYELATVRPEGFEPRVGGLAWLPDGRLAVATWDPIGAVYLLDGVQGDDPAQIRVQRFAAGLAEPLGLCAVDGRLFVLQKQELTELVDLDHDGTCDEYRCVSNAWPVSANFHEFAFGLVHQDGAFYANLAIAIDPGGKSTRPQVEGRGSVLRIPDGGGPYEVVAHGLRTPNGIGLGADGAIFLTDNQGDWLPVSKLLRLAKGAFYGSRSVLLEAAADLPVTPPVLWLPQGEIGNSPSQPALLPADHGPYGGQLVHGDVTYGGLQRDFLEEVDGVWQGAVLRFTQGLEAGVNRVVVGPDGALYVGGIGSTGNWGQTGKQRFGLQRLRYRGGSAFEMLAVRARSNGLEIELTEPLRAGIGWDPASWQVQQWRYQPTEDYGGPKLDEEALEPRSASVSDDRRRVFLELVGMREEHVLHVRMADPSLVSEAGREPWSTEAWYTLNRIPKGRDGQVRPRPPEAPPNVLSDAERRDGWRLLFDGKTLAGWRGYGGRKASAGWAVEDGAISRAGVGGDIVTDETFGDFELALEWKIGPGGNSGIFYGVGDGFESVWETGPEMQVLDNELHADGGDPATSAGACYALYAPERDVTRPVGLWNEARIRVEKGHVTHWLNGRKLFEYELESPDWEARVAASKFAKMPAYGRVGRGRIALQDHGDAVWYRSIRIRALD